MKKLYSLLLTATVFLLSVALVNTASAQVVLTESFDSTTFLPTSWSAAPLGSTFNYWTRSANGTFPSTTPHSGAGMARYNSRTAPAGTIQTIATPAFSLTGRGVAIPHVSIWVFRNDTLPLIYDTLNILVNTSLDTLGATTIGTIARSRQISLPDTQATNGWFQYTFDIPNSFSGAINYILLRGVTRSGGNTGYRIFVDDLSWDSYPTPCNGTPAAGTITSYDTLLCGGSGSTNLILNGTSNGFSGINYQWQSSGIAGGPYSDFGTNSLTQNTGLITATTYYRCKSTCSLTNDSSFTAEYTIQVSTLPPPTITVSPSSANHCAGSDPVLLVGSGGVSYAWSPSTGLNSTQTDSVYASPAATTTYLLTGYDAIGCHDTVTVRVSNRNAPTVTVSPLTSAVCLGDSLTLTATSTGVGGGGGTTVTYTWNPGGLTGNIITVYPTSDTAFTVTGVTNYGCTNDNSVDTSLVTIAAPAVAAFTYSIAGDVISLTNTSTDATSYNWNFGNGASSTADSPVYAYAASGSFAITLVATNGCNSDSSTSIVSVIYDAIASSPSLSNNIYPNPATNTIHFSLARGIDKIEICNILGNALRTFNGSFKASNHSIDLNGIENGVYFLRLTSGSSVQVIRFVKQ